MAQPPFYPQAGGPVSQPVYFAPPQSPEHPADSVGSWMLALFLTGIFIVGFIYVLVVAFGGSASPSRCNWARAMLLWQIIAIILVVVFIALGGWALFEAQGSH